MDFIRRSRVEIASQEKSWCGENRKNVEADNPCGRKQELLDRRVVRYSVINRVGRHQVATSFSRAALTVTPP